MKKEINAILTRGEKKIKVTGDQGKNDAEQLSYIRAQLELI